MKNLNTSDLTDGELLARFEQGRDQSAFAEVVRRHGRMVLGVAARNLDSRQDAEDAFQATFLALARAVDKLRNKERVAAWLHGTARKAASSIRRSAERRRERLDRMKELASNVTKVAHDPVEQIANGELVRVLDEEIGKLPEKLRSVVVLCYLDGMKQTDAAKQMGISESAVRSQLSVAKERLKNRLVARGVTASVAAIAASVSSYTKANAALSGSLVADTTAKAVLYAAGKSAAEVGVSSSIMHAANQILASMTTVKVTACCLLAFSIVVMTSAVAGIGVSPGKAGTLFVDDFEDGSHVDGSPVTWHTVEQQPGIVEVRNGNLLLARNARSVPDFEVAVDADEIVRRDMSLRMEAKPMNSNSIAGVVMRAQAPDDTSGYFAGVGHSRQLGGSFAIAGVGLANNKQGRFFPSNRGPIFRLPYDVRNEFTNLQIDAFGDDIKIWVWKSGTPMPNNPTFVEVSVTSLL